MSSDTCAELTRLLDEIRNCRLCVSTPVKPLPHEPRPVLRVHRDARICVCGQAPGTRVHASGMPFTDPSGVRLRAWMGVTEAEFYDERRVAVVPMGFCFPGLNAKGGDLPPRRECAPAWREKIFKFLPNLELMLLVGVHAQAWHMKAGCGPDLAATIRASQALAASGAQPLLFALPHPSWRNNAWLKRNPWFETEIVPDLQLRVRKLLRV